MHVTVGIIFIDNYQKYFQITQHCSLFYKIAGVIQQIASSSISNTFFNNASIFTAKLCDVSLCTVNQWLSVGIH